MTLEQLQKAAKVNEELQDKKKFLKAYDSQYVNTVKACFWDGNTEDDQSLLLEKEPKLQKLIREYVSNRIEELEKIFEDI